MKSVSQLEETLQTYFLPQKSRLLLAAFADGTATQDQLAGLTHNIQFDNESSLYLLSLSILGFQNHWGFFPASITARLQGLHRYYQVSNSATAAYLRPIVQAWKQADIPVMFSGATALRFGYVADRPRVLRGCDITVPAVFYEKSLDILHRVSSVSNMPCTGRQPQLRLHAGIPDSRFFNSELLWQRSFSVPFLDQQIILPCAQDMLLHLLCIPFGPYAVEEPAVARTQRLLDCIAVLKHSPHLNFQQWTEQIHTLGLRSVIRFQLATLSKFCPNVLPPQRWESAFPADYEYRQYLREMVQLYRSRHFLEKYRRPLLHPVSYGWYRWQFHQAKHRILQQIKNKHHYNYEP